MPYYTPPGLNGIDPTLVRPMDRQSWEQSRHRRAAEYSIAHPPESTTPPNPFKSPQGYIPPTTVDITPLQRGEAHELAVRLSEVLCDHECIDDPAGALTRHADRLAAISVYNTGGDPRAKHARQWAESLITGSEES
jgi:hypothetical protein